MGQQRVKSPDVAVVHRIRLQVAGGAHPRFARNPGNGQVVAAAEDLEPTQYEIGLDAGHPSVLLLPAGNAYADPW